MSQPATHAFAHHRGPDRTGYHEADPAGRATRVIGVQMQDKTATSRAPATTHRQRELVAVAQAVRGRQHVRASGRELLTTLGPPRGEDGPPGPGPHTQPEPVRLGATTVVRLEGALAHDNLRGLGGTGRTWQAGRRASGGPTVRKPAAQGQT